MTRPVDSFLWTLRIWLLRFGNDTRGQDILEYALFIAAICTLYAAVSPNVATSVCAIISKVNVHLQAAAATGQ